MQGQLPLWKTGLIKTVGKDHLIKQWEADTIYLIPSKLMCIPECFKEKNVNIKMILSGSQSLGRKDAESLKKIFPDTKVGPRIMVQAS